MKYRTEIDGLRALAVIPVVLFHAHVPGFSGGYVGVDIFFVISGYLITTILIDEIENQKFSISNFYERRLRRILPALFVVVTLSFPIAYVLLLPTEFKDFSQSILAVTFFSSNFLFFLESDYFATASELKPLLHTWSLAIEEQYYVFFPLFLMLFWRFGKVFVYVVLTLTFLISFGIAVWASTRYPSANFYLLPSRVWELLIGAGLAFLIFYRGYFQNRLVNELGGFLGLGAVIYSVLVFDSTTPFPSAYALVPTIGAAFLLLFAIKETTVQRLLSMDVFVYIGLISYSLYLWHQPVFAFYKQYVFFDKPSQTSMIILALIVVGLAHLSWKYVETPFRSKQVFDKKRIFQISLLASCIMIILGISGIKSSAQKSTPAFLSDFNIANFTLDNVALREESWQGLRALSNNDNYQVDNNDYDQTLWYNIQDKRAKMLIIGNSHSKDIYNVLSFSQVVKQNFQLARYGQQIEKLNVDLFNLPNYKYADVIMIASQYRNDRLNLRTLVNKLRLDGKVLVIVRNITEFDSVYARKLTLADKVVKQSLEMKINDPISISEEINKVYSDVILNSTMHPHILASNMKISTIAKEFPEIIVLDRNDYLCDIQTLSCFASDAQLNKYFYDYSHHSLEGAKFYGSRVDEINWLKEVLIQLKDKR